jgi:hypothetical protein
MQMPTPPVTQWRNTQSATAPHEKVPGSKASNAPKCKAPIQMRAGQAIPADWGRVELMVVMLIL